METTQIITTGSFGTRYTTRQATSTTGWGVEWEILEHDEGDLAWTLLARGPRDAIRAQFAALCKAQKR